MQTRLTLRPGQRGTKRLARRFGDRLVAVRYRYDAERRRRVKTVELVVDEAPWEPPGSTLVAVRVRLDEPVLRGQRSVWGGRATVRAALYMSALAAVRPNPPVKALYERLLEKGKPKKVALVTCNAVVRDEEAWNVSHAAVA